MKTVVITGSARGLGYEMAIRFRQNDFNVVLSDINEKTLEEAKSELLKFNGEGEIKTCICDVTNYENLQNLWDFAVEHFSSVDIWINNAGVNQPDKAIFELEKNEIDFVLNVDLKGAIYGSKIAFERMKKQGFGQIYNIEGYGSNDAMMKGLTVYGTSKRAITYFTQALAKESEVLGLNIQVGRLSPGIMITSFITNANGDKDKIVLSEKTKKVYNILGDYPDVVADFLVSKIIANKKNNIKINWLTNKKAFFRFLTAGFNKRNFFE